ncbi:MAG: hypothetical protein FD123_4122 [Bacteroidetes bacterium]|nr:MAG: hypothetical protein FD123_4122 [Bacteroidota bacterium]
MKKIILILSFAFLSAPPANAQTAQDDFSFTKPDSLQKLKKLELWATQYFIHQFRSGGKITFEDTNGVSLGLYGDTCDFCEAALEGTAYVTDSAGNVIVLNYAKTGSKTYVDCRKCKKYAGSKLNVENWGKTQWVRSSGFGDGVRNYRLLPYRTIAVDKKTIPYGTVIYIPKARGITIELPNGEKVVHDGYFFAGDTGGAIKENHIDVFTGVFSGNPFPAVIQSNGQKTFEAYIVTDQQILGTLTKAQVK